MVRIIDNILIEWVGQKEVEEAKEFRKICENKGKSYNKLLKELVRGYVEKNK